MAFLVIDGITVPVANGQATKRASERVGTTTRMFAGNLRSTVRYAKRVWHVTTKLLEPADAAAIEAISDAGSLVNCSGDMIGSVISCEVVAGESPFTTTGSGLRRSLAITLREA